MKKNYHTYCRSINALMTFLLILCTIQVSYVHSQTQLFSGEAPVENVFLKNGDFGPKVNPTGSFSCSFNRARGVISIGAEVQSDGFASWDHLDVYFYYNGQWVKVLSTQHLQRGVSGEPAATTWNPTPKSSTVDVSQGKESSGQYRPWSSDNSYRMIMSTNSNSFADRENNIYLKDWSNLNRYNFTYTSLPGTVNVRTSETQDATFGIQLTKYAGTDTRNYPTYNSKDPSVQIPSGYDTMNVFCTGNSPGVTYDQFTPEQGVLVLNIANLPPDMISSPSFKVRVYAHDQAQLHSRVLISTYNNENPLTSAPTGLTASTSVCGKVNLTWSNSSNTLPTEAPMTLNNAIFRDGNFLMLVSGTATTYSDASAVQNVTYNYTVRHVAFSELGKTYYQSNPSNSASGNIKPTPDIATSPAATSDRCTGQIEVTWQYNATSPQNFRIDRATSSTGTYTTIAGTLPGTDRLYLNNTSVTRGTQYFYKIYSISDCSVLSSGAASVSGISPADPAVATSVTAVYNSTTKKVTVGWTDNANNETQYQVIRQDDLGNTVFFDANKNTTSFIDDGVSTCRDYTYKIKVTNDCVSAGLISTSQATVNIPPPSISTTFDATHQITASKGYFTNRVELNYSANNPQNLDLIKIYRKIQGTTDSSLIASVNPSSGLYVDNTADARVYYEYSMIGERNCNGTVLYTNYTKDIGFRNPTGTLSGHIEFTGGIAVEDAKVVAEPSAGDTGYSLKFTGGSAVAKDSPNIEPGTQFRMDFWIKPLNTTTGNIIDKGGAFTFARSGSNYTVTLNTGSNHTITFPATNLPDAVWKPVTIQYDGSNLFVLVNGVQVGTQAVTGSIVDNTSDLTLGGSGTQFNLDEFRLLNVATDSLSASRDCSRYLNGNESGFKVSLHFDEGVGTHAYDVSKQGNVYNANHFAFSGSTAWDVNRPASAELSYIAYTNSLGNYLISGIRYNGSGDNYTVVPAKGVHSFSPGSRSVFIGDLSQVFNNQDFTDISSFLVTGTVRYYNPDGTPTNCFVDDVNLLVDGQPVIKNGQSIKTDVNGYFEIRVPIGPHIVTIDKFQHDMMDSIFPPTGTYDFQGPVSGIEFKDSTTRVVTGRVVGGLIEANKLPGMGRSENNIGVAKIRFISPITATPATACFSREILTNSTTGEYTVKLPPLQYKVDTVFVQAAPTQINPANLSNSNTTFNLKNFSDPTKIVDTLYDGSGAFVSVDSIEYTKRLDFVYRSAPKIDFTDTLGNKFIGEDTVQYGGTVIPIPSTATSWGPFGWPVFTQGQTYYGNMNANEFYTNFDTGIQDTVPLNGKVNFDNALINGADPTPSVDLVSGNARYTFVAGDPNNSTGSISDFDYTEPLQITVIPQGAPAVTWKPNIVNYPSNPEYRAYILGSKITGTGVATLGPERVDYILRDPAGSGSSAQWTSGNATTLGSNFSLNVATSSATSASVKTGFEESVGLGVQVPVAVEVESSLDMTVEASATVGGGFSETISSSASVATRDDPDHVGADADIFIGRSRNWLVGPTSNIELVDVASCTGSTICFGPTVSGKILSKKLGYAVQPSTVKTRFSYTQSEIENVVIPTLESLRSTKLVAPTYTSVLSSSDPHYGANNDDPVFGASKTSTTPFIYETADKSGPSYTFNGTVMDNDTVRTINQQIALWKQTLARNEREKWQAVNNQGGVLIDNFTLGSAVVNNSYDVNSNAEFTFEWELSISEEQKLAVSAEAGGNGAGIEQTLGFKETVGGSIGLSVEKSTSFQYTLTDGDDGDIFSIDVYKSSEGTGNIFVTRGGRSMCPYEGAVQPHYWDPLNPGNPITSHTYIDNPTATIQLATIQREIPNINISPSQQFNIPSNQAAVYQLLLTNQSPEVVDNDIEMRIRVAGQSNPNGAVVKIDGLDPNTYYTIPAGANVVKTLTVERGPVFTEYDSLMIIFSSACSDDLADTSYISVQFIPTCTELGLINPTNNWILNSSNNDEMLVRISDYNYNYGAATAINGPDTLNLGLNKIGFEMKPATSSTWLQIEQFLKYPGITDSVIPSNNVYTQYPWDVASIPDGNYEIRAKSYCLNYDGSFSSVTSPVFAGVMDRINPRPFGTPSPADGILDPNDDITIQFNEPIDLGSINNTNFQVRGVLNGVDLRHSEFLDFNGTANYVEVPGGVGLQGKDYTVEFWARVNGSGNDQVVVSQGIDPNESMAIGFNTSDKLRFNVNGQEVVSNSAISNMNQWNHYAIVYDFQNHYGFLYQNGNLLNSGNTSLQANYNGSGKVYFGKQMPQNANYYNGNLHEVRIWNKVRTSGDIIQNFNKTLSASSTGLLHNWQMNEASGTFASDQIRHRDAVLNGASWQVDPNGYAGSFDGSDDYLKVKASAIPITKNMDATIEFWFNSTQSTAATLFSSGKGDGLGSDSLVGWDIHKDAAGKIHVQHKGLDFVAVDSNFFDGSWHHFSMVLNRTANLSVYIDGNLQNGVPSNTFGAISGPFYTVGARGYLQPGGIYVQDNYYQGLLDEVRVWNTARVLEQVKRDVHNRLKGDESGLLAYTPFETYTIVLNVPILNPSISNLAAGHQSDTTWGMNGLITTNQTPVVKIPRPVENVNFTWSLNNDKIVITPTTAPELLENQTIDITVQGLFDLHGNKMESPKTWIAYFNKNQVYWENNDLEYTIAEDSVLHFSAKILNTGGALKDWTITGVPSWLTASATSGSIPPNSQQTINFTVPAGLNVGEFYADLSLKTDFNFNEILRLSVKVQGTPPNWVLDPTQFQYSMSVIGDIELDGVINGNPNTLIAGFMHDTLCALGHLQYVSSFDRYEVFLNVLSNQQIGDSVSFQVYDANTGRVYVEVTPELYFIDGDLQGTLAAPITFSSTLTMEKDIPLTKGWTWISLPLASHDQVTTNRLFANLHTTTGDLVKGQTVYDQYDTGSGWIGSITGSGGYKNTLTYKVKSAVADTLQLIGQKIHPDSSDAEIAVVPGYNWIGFISIENLGINQALGNYSPRNGDLIKSQYEFAFYDSINASWTGSLTTLRPGLGYILKTNQTAAFHYPLAGYLRPENIPDNSVTPYYTMDKNEFEETMCVTVKSNICENNFQHSNLVLGAFDQDNKLRGYTLSKKDEGSGDSFYYLTLYGNTNGELLNLRFFDNTDGSLINTQEQLVFERNGFKGTNYTPVVANVDPIYACLQLGITESTADFSVAVEPNPFTENFKVVLTEPRSGKMELLDPQSKVVYSANLNAATVFQSGKELPDLAAGIYILRITFDNEDVFTSRLLKVTK